MPKSPPKDTKLQAQPEPAGAPLFLWVLVGIMATTQLVLSLSALDIFGSVDLRYSAILLGAFWQPIFAGLIPQSYSQRSRPSTSRPGYA